MDPMLILGARASMVLRQVRRTRRGLMMSCTIRQFAAASHSAYASYAKAYHTSLASAGWARLAHFAMPSRPCRLRRR